jgi:hypothetical protein
MATPRFNQIYGTILAGGTLSSEFALQGYSISGVMALSNSVNGTLGFMVSNKGDAQGGVYRPVYSSNGTAVELTINSGQGAVDTDALKTIRGYQYVRVSSSAQTNGLALMLVLESD